MPVTTNAFLTRAVDEAPCHRVTDATNEKRAPLHSPHCQASNALIVLATTRAQHLQHPSPPPPHATAPYHAHAVWSSSRYAINQASLLFYVRSIRKQVSIYIDICMCIHSFSTGIYVAPFKAPTQKCSRP